MTASGGARQQVPIRPHGSVCLLLAALPCCIARRFFEGGALWPVLVPPRHEELARAPNGSQGVRVWGFQG